MTVSCPTRDEMNESVRLAFERKFPELVELILQCMKEAASEGYYKAYLTDANDEEIPSPHSDARVTAFEFNFYYRPLLEEWFKDSGLDVTWGDKPEEAIDLTISWGPPVAKPDA